MNRRKVRYPVTSITSSGFTTAVLAREGAGRATTRLLIWTLESWS